MRRGMRQAFCVLLGECFVVSEVDKVRMDV